MPRQPGDAFSKKHSPHESQEEATGHNTLLTSIQYFTYLLPFALFMIPGTTYHLLVWPSRYDTIKELESTAETYLTFIYCLHLIVVTYHITQTCQPQLDLNTLGGTHYRKNRDWNWMALNHNLTFTFLTYFTLGAWRKFSLTHWMKLGRHISSRGWHYEKKSPYLTFFCYPQHPPARTQTFALTFIESLHGHSYEQPLSAPYQQDRITSSLTLNLLKCFFTYYLSLFKAIHFSPISLL